MSDFISKPPSKSQRPETFEGGMMPVPDDRGFFIIDLRSLKLDEKQVEQIHEALHEAVMSSLGKIKAPERGLRRLGGHLAGIAVQDV